MGAGRVDFRKQDFDTLVDNKGVRIYHEQAVRCACVVTPNGNPLPNCVNCHGVGFMFINGLNAKGVIQSVGSNPKFVQWSEVNAGTASITVKFKTRRLAWMDRIKVLDGEGIYTESVEVREMLIGGVPKLVGQLTYEPLRISTAYLFNGPAVAHTALVEEVDYEITGRTLTMITGSLGNNNSLSVALRYTHRPQYVVMDIPKDIRNTRSVKFGGVEERESLPVMAIIKKVHYFIDAAGIADAEGN